MENELKALMLAFCEDCCMRRQVARQIVRGGAPFNREQLDQLHQEFDTLYGGARAVHLPDLERFFSGIARYARYLRNLQDSGKEVEPGDWQMLLDDLEKWLRFDGKFSCCIMHGSDLVRSLQNIPKRTDNGDAR